MIKFIKSLFGFSNPTIKGELVYGKRKDESKPSYIPFSKNSGENPVIATEQFAMPRSGCELSSVMCVEGINWKKKMQLAMHKNGDPSMLAPLDLGSASQYLNIGGREMGVESYRGIGFGYLWADSSVAPVFVGSQEKSQYQSTKADFVVATRDTCGNTDKPVVRFRVDSRGQILAEGSYMPETPNALVNKQYLDTIVDELQAQIDEMKKK